ENLIRFINLLRRGERSIVVRMIADVAYVFTVLDLVIRPHDEHGTSVHAVERAALNQNPVVLTKRSVSVIAHCDHLVDSRRSAPSLLGKRKIHTYTDYFDAGNFGCFVIEPPGLCVADRRIERRDAENDPCLTAA